MFSMPYRRSLRVLGVSLALLTTGCGTYVPQIQEVWDSGTTFLTAGGTLEYRVKFKVYCDIVKAIQAQPALPKDWAVQVLLDLQVDETGALNPGATFINPLPSSQSYSTGIGATLSSQATREDKFGSYWRLSKLAAALPGNSCDNPEPIHGSSPLIETELGIREWMTNGLAIIDSLPSTPLTSNSDPTFKQDYLSYHIKFIIITSGGVTPTWKLVKLTTGNGSLALASANRTRTHDLLITLGPAFKANGANIAFVSHAAQEYGIAVSNGTRAVIGPFVTP
jgi:hypothetical protein